MNKKLLTAALAAVTFLPIITLAARDAGGYHGGSGHDNYNRNYNANYGNYGDHHDQNYNYGGYGGYSGGYGGYGGVINAYPPADAQPGMTDDSDALYQSYLRHNNTGY